MASDRELKARIQSVESIGQVTKAMKMVASAQIRKIESQANDSRPYVDKLKEVVDQLSDQVGEEDRHPLQEQRPVQNVGVIIIGSDSGLCGAYNSNVFKLAASGIDSLKDGNKKLVKSVLLGKKAIRFFKRRDLKADIERLDWKPTFEQAQQLADECAKWFLDGEVDQIIVYGTRPVNKLVSKPHEVVLLPMGGSKADAQGKEATAGGVTYKFEPCAKEALATILPSYLRAEMLQNLLDSKAAELGSRLNAMTNATDNAEKLASELTTQYYRIRQNKITTEIIEISSGAEALKK